MYTRVYKRTFWEPWMFPFQSCSNCVTIGAPHNHFQSPHLNTQQSTLPPVHKETRGPWKIKDSGPKKLNQRFCWLTTCLHPWWSCRWQPQHDHSAELRSCFHWCTRQTQPSQIGYMIKMWPLISIVNHQFELAPLTAVCFIWNSPQKSLKIVVRDIAAGTYFIRGVLGGLNVAGQCHGCGFSSHIILNCGAVSRGCCSTLSTPSSRGNGQSDCSGTPKNVPPWILVYSQCHLRLVMKQLNQKTLNRFPGRDL